MIRSLFILLAVLASCACSAQFRVDYYSGNCYVRTGEGSIRLMDRTRVLRLPVYLEDNSLNRKQLKRKRVRNGFSRPAVYGQDPEHVNVMTVLQPARETETVTYYIVRDTNLTESYIWEDIQESWTEYEDYVFNDEWQRCNCGVTNESLQVVADVLIREGDLPSDFLVNEENKESRKQFIAALNAYAQGYELKPVLEKAPAKLHIPFLILEAMYLRYVPKAKLIQDLSRR
jgi:hypothetical protein